jgi:hypothetical protein
LDYSNTLIADLQGKVCEGCFPGISSTITAGFSSLFELIHGKLTHTGWWMRHHDEWEGALDATDLSLLSDWILQLFERKDVSDDDGEGTTERLNRFVD